MQNPLFTEIEPPLTARGACHCPETCLLPLPVLVAATRDDITMEIDTSSLLAQVTASGAPPPQLRAPAGRVQCRVVDRISWFLPVHLSKVWSILTAY